MSLHIPDVKINEYQDGEWGVEVEDAGVREAMEEGR